MFFEHFLDRFSLSELFVYTIILLAFFIEVGFRLGALRRGKRVKAQTAQVRALMGAILGLLAFMLAFTFSATRTHYETQLQNMAEEATIASAASA